MNKAVLLVTFNRKDYLMQVFAAVAKAKPPRLYLASDGPRANKPGEKEVVDDIRKWMLKNVTWPCEVKTRFLEKNSGGCGPGVSGSVTWFFQNEQDGIILEDDCVPAQSFFRYCEELLDRYADDKRVWHIAGDAPIDADINETYYFAKTMHCWGWAGWADRWKFFDLHAYDYGDEVYRSISPNRRVQRFWRRTMKRCRRGEIETWDYQWAMAIISRHGLCATPTHPLVSNIGDIGVHPQPSAGTRLHRRAEDIEGEIVHPPEVMVHARLSQRILEEAFPCSARCEMVYFVKLILKAMLPSAFLNRFRGRRP